MRIENAALVKEFRGRTRCEDCGNFGSSSPLHVHHEPTWGSHHQETRLTLVRICMVCHTLRHGPGHNRGRIVSIICQREACTVDDRQMVIDLIWRADKGADRSWFEYEAAMFPPSAFVLLERTLEEAGI